MKSMLVAGAFPRLETERLVLRQMTLDDAESVLSYFADEEVTRYIDVPSMTDLEQAEKVIMYGISLFERREGIRWGIARPGDERLIGTCGFDNVTKVRGSRGEVKYDLSRPCWGRGLMAEALAEVVRFGFEEMELNRIEALVVKDGDRSQRLLRRLGFQEEGTLRGYSYWKGRYWDEVSFSLLRDEWSPT